MLTRPDVTRTLVCPRCDREKVLNPAFPQAAVCTSCAVALWGTAEEKFAEHTYHASQIPGKVKMTAGALDRLITAPNAVNYFRGLEQQRAARWTGSAAQMLAATTSSSSLAMFGPPRSVPYRDSPEYAFADALTSLLTPNLFVLDIIGMRDRAVDVCLGMGPFPDDRSRLVADRIRKGFTARGVRVGTNEPFPALAPYTVTSYLQTQHEVSSLQVAVAAWLRDPLASAAMAKLTLDVLRDALAELTSTS